MTNPRDTRCNHKPGVRDAWIKNASAHHSPAGLIVMGLGQVDEAYAQANTYGLPLSQPGFNIL